MTRWILRPSRYYDPGYVYGPKIEAETEVMAVAEYELVSKILRGMVEGESEPCSFDHHGCCQEHGWFGEPGECGIREARQLLGLDP